MSEKSNKFLEVKDLVVEYQSDGQTVHAVNGVSLHLDHGKTLGLVGETGAGKTTIAKSILRILPDVGCKVTGGEIHLDGQELLTLHENEMRKIRGNKISMIFQDPMTALNPVQKVGDQIAEVVRLHNDNHVNPEERAKEMLETVGIPAERYSEYPHQFSGGMKQRVVIAIGLSCNPKLLIADEPTTALDVTIQAQILDIMQNLKKQYQTSMIMITHDLGIVAKVCDEVAVMYAGRIVEYGSLRDIFKRTKHPYTEGLFDSLPNIKERSARLNPIPGLVPDPTVVQPGCAFAPRCRYATEACKMAVPELRCMGNGHYVACSAYDDPNFKIRKGEKVDG